MVRAVYEVTREVFTDQQVTFRFVMVSKKVVVRRKKKRTRSQSVWLYTSQC